MNTQQIADNTTTFIAAFGNTAHKGIDMYRTGAQRLAGKVGERWDTAFKEASPKLKPETRKNAKNAKQVVSRYYAKSVAMSTDGAAIVVDTVVGAAIAGVERAAALGNQYTANKA